MWTKAISEEQSRWQSRVLGAVLAPLLLLLCGYEVLVPGDIGWKLRGMGISLTFAVLVWVLRAATPAAAACGGTICLLVLLAAGKLAGLAPLLTLFVLTFGATRMGGARKASAGLAEGHGGRSASQVLANLGVAGLTAHWPVIMVACLVEATADTVSSEIGQAFGGRPVLLTTLRPATPGTDGAVTLLGTFAGLAAGGVVAGVAFVALPLTPVQAAVAWIAGISGFFVDSLLGATVERRGWLGNDCVNFASTLMAAPVTMLILKAMAR